MAKKNDGAEKAIRDIRRATRRILLEGLRGEDSIVEPCCDDHLKSPPKADIILNALRP